MVKFRLITSFAKFFLYGKATIALIYSAAISVLLLVGCTPTHYVPVEAVRTEYRDKDNAELLGLIKSLTEQVAQKDKQIDSLMQSNRELLILSENGDTLRHDREVIVYRASHREKELEKIVNTQRDSVLMLRQKLESIKADTISVPYPVEKRLTRWQQAKIDYGGEAIVALALIVIVAIAWFINKFRK